MEYTDPDPDLAARARDFVDSHVIPAERAHASAVTLPSDTSTALREHAIEHGLSAPDAPVHHGGQGHDLRTALPVIEQAARTINGPELLRVNSPDHANIHLLDRHGTPDQLDAWLHPLVTGQTRSAFAFTEPPPGAGSDPTQLETTATEDDEGWVINGHKWWITQGADADLLILAARTTPPSHDPVGCTLFLVPADTPGVRVVRRMTGMRRHGAGGHAELRLHDVRIPSTAILGTINEGFAIARDRATLSAILRGIRKTGMAMRALAIANAYVRDRRSGGEPLAAKQTIRQELANAHAHLHLLRTLIRDTTHRAVADQTTLAIDLTTPLVNQYASTVITTAVTACGGHGVATDLPLGEFLARTGTRNHHLSDIGTKERVATRVLAPGTTDPRELETMTRFTR